MKTSRFITLASVLCAATIAVSCAKDSSPVAPAIATNGSAHDLLGALTGTVTTAAKNLGLLSCSKMPAAWASATIDQRGGTITVGPHTFTVPKNALSGPVTITAYMPSDNVNQIQFSPEGLTFARSASLTMSYANCNLLGSLAPKRIAYVDSKENILYFLLSIDDLLNQRVTGSVDHFSEYAISW
jgi:hypothetical protein